MGVSIWEGGKAERLTTALEGIAQTLENGGGTGFNPWKNMDVCFFGDSLGAGYNNNDYSFIDILEEAGIFKSVHKNCTTGARTTALPAKLVESATYLAEADIVYCEFEFNDIAALATASASISDITSAIRSSYTYIRQNNPTCAIVWMPLTIYHANKFSANNEPYFYNWCNATYPIFAELGIGILPTYDLISAEGHVTQDGSHLNTAGHRLVANLVMQNPLGYSSYPTRLEKPTNIVVVPEQTIETTSQSSLITNYAEVPIVGERYSYSINGQAYEGTGISLNNSIYIGDPRTATVGVFEFSNNYLYFTLVNDNLIGNTYTVKAWK